MREQPSFFLFFFFIGAVERRGQWSVFTLSGPLRKPTGGSVVLYSGVLHETQPENLFPKEGQKVTCCLLHPSISDTDAPAALWNYGSNGNFQWWAFKSWQRLRKCFHFPPKPKLTLAFGLSRIRGWKSAKLQRLQDTACQGGWSQPWWWLGAGTWCYVWLAPALSMGSWGQRCLPWGCCEVKWDQAQMRKNLEIPGPHTCGKAHLLSRWLLGLLSVSSPSQFLQTSPVPVFPRAESLLPLSTHQNVLVRGLLIAGNCHIRKVFEWGLLETEIQFNWKPINLN